MNDISLFDFIDELEPEDIQKEVVAADLSMLLVHSDYSRTRLGTDLGYGKSRISRILSGDENLTLKTLTKVADTLGYTFDVVFYNKNYPKPKQPWNIDRDNKKLAVSKKVSTRKVFNLELQTGDQVVSDVLAGNESDRYIRVTEGNDSNINYLLHKDGDLTLSVLPTSHKTFKYDLTSKVVDYEY